MSLDDYQKKVGAALRHLRDGTSQDEVADKLGMHRTYYSAIERGEKNVTLYTLERLARLHHVSIGYILNLAENLR